MMERPKRATKSAYMKSLRIKNIDEEEEEVKVELAEQEEQEQTEDTTPVKKQEPRKSPSKTIVQEITIEPVEEIEEERIDVEEVQDETPKQKGKKEKAMKSFECPTCYKAFPDTWKFNRHLRIHTGERPFKCDVCERRFSDQSTWRSHCQKVDCRDGRSPSTRKRKSTGSITIESSTKHPRTVEKFKIVKKVQPKELFAEKGGDDKPEDEKAAEGTNGEENEDSVLSGGEIKTYVVTLEGVETDGDQQYIVELVSNEPDDANIPTTEQQQE